MEETRKQQAQRLAEETGLSESNVYKRLARGESEDKIRDWGEIARRHNEEAARRLNMTMALTLRQYRRSLFVKLADYLVPAIAGELCMEAGRVMEIVQGAFAAYEAGVEYPSDPHTPTG